jgi:ABC-2 type transport system permease protein
LLFFFFSLANASLGMMLSSLVSEEIVALDIALFYNSPAFIFSGFTFPILGMPFLDSLWAKFIPYTYFLHAFFKLFEMGAPLAYANTEFLALSAFALTGVITTYVALKVKFKKAGQPELTLKKA